MAAPAAILSILVTANSTAATASLTKTQAELDATKASAMGAGSAFDKAFGKAAGTAVIVGFTAAVASSVSKAVDFQQAMTRVETQAGASHKEVQNLSKSIVDFAKSGKSAFGPTDLANAMFRIKSGGIDAAHAMGTLKAAVELASVGGSDLEDTTSALVSVMNTGIKGSKNLGQSIGSLNAIVGQGNMRMSDLVSAMGTGFFSTAKQMGISLNQAGAGLATLTAQGQPATQSATRLMMAWRMMIAPTDSAKSALDSIGVSWQSLGALMENGKMPAAMGILAKHLDALGKNPAGKAKAAGVIKELFGARGSSGITALLQGLSDYRKRLRGVEDGQKHFADAAKEQSGTMEEQWNRLKARADAYQVEIGQKVIPVLQTSLKLTNDMLAGKGIPGIVGKGLALISSDTILRPFNDIKDIATPAIQSIVALLNGDFSGALKHAGETVKAAMLAPFRILIDTLKMIPGVSGVFNAVVSKAKAAFGKLPGLASDAWGKVKSVVGQGISLALKIGGDVVGAAKDIWNKVKGVVSDVIHFVLQLPGVGSLVSIAKQIWQKIDDALPDIHISLHIDTPSAGGLLDSVKSAAGSVTNLVPHPGHAMGTNSAIGGMALVGERGPELVNLPRGAAVYPNHETRPYMKSIGAYADGTPGRPSLQKMVAFGKAEAAKHYPYVFGGGHGGFHGPYDCSGFVSAILHSAGLLDHPMDTIALKGWGKSGSSGDVVVGVRGGAGASGHTMMRAGDTYFESGGGHGAAVVSGWDGGFPTKRYANLRDVTQAIKPQSPQKVFGKNYSKNELATLAAFVGMSNPSLMAAIAMAESKGVPGASNTNTNGSIDRGLWQINSIWGGLSTFDPLRNAKAAKTVLAKQGLTAWSTYKNGDYKKYLGGKVLKEKLKHLQGTGKKAGKIKGDSDTPPGVQNLVDQAQAFQDNADHAGDLAATFAGLTEDQWLHKALDTLWQLRQKLIDVHAQLQQRITQLSKSLGAAKDKKSREKIRNQLASAQGMDSSVLSTLTDVQGVGGPMGKMASLPAIGQSLIGGSIFDVQLKLRDLQSPTTSGAADTDSTALDLQKQLNIQLAQRLSASESQFKVLSSTQLPLLPPYGGGYAKGGLVSALVGERGPELASFPTGTRIHSNSDTASMLQPTIVVNGDIVNVPRGKDPIEVLIGDERFDAAVRRVRSRGGNRPLPGARGA